MAIGLLLVTIVASGIFGWLYWGWKSEQQILVELGAAADAWSALGGEVHLEPLGGKKIQGYLEPASWVLDRVTGIKMPLATLDRDLTEVARLERLKKLDLSDASVTDLGIEKLKTLTELVWLSLNGRQVTDAGVVHLSGMRNLRVLYLDGTSVTDAGLEHLEGLEKLQVLGLSFTGVTDKGLEHLKNMTELQRLHLRNTKVTDVGLRSLKIFRHLQFVSVSYTMGITEEGIEDLKAASPGLEIDWGS